MNACPVAASRTARLEPWMAAPEGDPDALPPDAAAAELISQSRFNLPLSRLSQPADGAGAGGSGGNGGLRIWVQGAGGGFGGRPRRTGWRWRPAGEWPPTAARAW